MNSTAHILVTGASGNIGTPLVQQLRAAGSFALRAASRCGQLRAAGSFALRAATFLCCAAKAPTLRACE